MFDPRLLCCSSFTTAVGGTKDTNIVDSESPYRGTNHLWVPLYKHKLCSTYGYLRTSIIFVTLTGDLNKYNSAISTSMCIRLLYEFMNNYDICYYISVTVI